jgi:hypothetical protein
VLHLYMNPVSQVMHTPGTCCTLWMLMFNISINSETKRDEDCG